MQEGIYSNTLIFDLNNSPVQRSSAIRLVWQCQFRRRDLDSPQYCGSGSLSLPHNYIAESSFLVQNLPNVVEDIFTAFSFWFGTQAVTYIKSLYIFSQPLQLYCHESASEKYFLGSQTPRAQRSSHIITLTRKKSGF